MTKATTGVSDSEGAAAEGLVGLRQAADEIGVHYMTAYRYVRTGRLAAEKKGGRWWIDQADLVRIVNGGAASAVAPRPRAELVEPLAARLVRSDYSGSWQLVEGVLASGGAPTAVHQELLGPAMTLIGEGWRNGELTIADEHRATATCQRILGRMSAMFRPPGRRRGSVVLGAISGDAHGLPSAMLADMLENEHISVIDLGPNTPASSFSEVAREVDDLVGVGIVATLALPAKAAAQACTDLALEFPGALVVLGGAGVSALPQKNLDASTFAVSHSADQARELFIAAARRPTRTETDPTVTGEVPAVG